MDSRNYGPHKPAEQANAEAHEPEAAAFWREEMGIEPPTNMGPIPVSQELALKLLATEAWYCGGDREANECVRYVYLGEIERTMEKLDFRFEHFVHGDGSEEQGGQGIRIVMTPKEGVSAEDLPETELDEDG